MASRSITAALLLFLGAATAHAADPAQLPVAIFGDQVAFAIEAPGPAKLDQGFFGGGSISGFYPTIDTGHILLVTPPGDAVLGRRLDQPLASRRFLTWSWRRLPLDTGQPDNLTDDAPMRLIVGFSGRGSAAPALQPPSQGGPHASPDLPPYDHAVVVVWSDYPWENGAADRHGPLARFIAHGGGGDSGQWWEEAVDLASLHSRLWPEAEIGEVRISWIAVGLRRAEGRSRGEVAGIALAP
jgi:hypothetical protein